ncbi:hypothetical protein QQZ08_001012 [Neonectria magnoliae]|uniref:Uncharacterized protein n=1 Tax=Neonectria magnoliae TaxID=2732573 RepID=A0ABR1IFM9_9HYPO
MCKHVTERFRCGHETKFGYFNCKTGKRMKDSRSSCGVVDFGALIYPEGKCDEPDCKYLEAMRLGWKCCACKNGPNVKHRCDQDANSLGWKHVACRHRFCSNCDVWGTRKQKKPKFKGKDKDTGRDDGGGGATGGPAAKGGSIRKSIRSISRRVASGSIFGK